MLLKNIEGRVKLIKLILSAKNNWNENIPLKKPVKYAVRSVPIIHDTTMEDAIESGLDKVAELIDSGSEAPGIILNQCSPEFGQSGF